MTFLGFWVSLTHLQKHHWYFCFFNWFVLSFSVFFIKIIKLQRATGCKSWSKTCQTFKMVQKCNHLLTKKSTLITNQNNRKEPKMLLYDSQTRPVSLSPVCAEQSRTVWTQEVVSILEFSGLSPGQSYCAVANFSFPIYTIAASPKSAPGCVAIRSSSGKTRWIKTNCSSLKQLMHLFVIVLSDSEDREGLSWLNHFDWTQS